jgi:large subunit ribosomal protein L35
MAKKIKIKTHSGAKKRFRVTKNGMVKFMQSNRRHRLTQKPTKAKRQSRTAGYADESIAKTIKRLIPYK